MLNNHYVFFCAPINSIAQTKQMLERRSKKSHAIHFSYKFTQYSIAFSIGGSLIKSSFVCVCLYTSCMCVCAKCVLSHWIRIALYPCLYTHIVWISIEFYCIHHSVFIYIWYIVRRRTKRLLFEKKQTIERNWRQKRNSWKLTNRTNINRPNWKRKKRTSKKINIYKTDNSS